MNIVSKAMSVIVTDHAYWRSAERYPDFDTLDIEQDVREAYEAGRVGLRRPLGFFQTDSGFLHAWSRDGHPPRPRSLPWVRLVAERGATIAGRRGRPSPA